MVDKETLKQFENIDFNLVQEYIPSKEEVLKQLKKNDII